MKSAGTAYLLWLFGLHRFYLEKPLTGILYIMTCGGIGFWMVLDLFTIPSQVEYCNIKNEMKFSHRYNGKRRK